MLTRRRPDPQPATVEAAPSSAQERYAALTAEQQRIQAELADHAQQRARLMREDGSIDLIRASMHEDEGRRLRLAQIEQRLEDVEQELEQERLAAYEARWQSYKPVLTQAEQDLDAAIGNLYAALARTLKRIASSSALD